MAEVSVPYFLVKFACMIQSSNTTSHHLRVKMCKISYFTDYSTGRTMEQMAQFNNERLCARELSKRSPSILI